MKGQIYFTRNATVQNERDAFARLKRKEHCRDVQTKNIAVVLIVAGEKSNVAWEKSNVADRSLWKDQER